MKVNANYVNKFIFHIFRFSYKAPGQTSVSGGYTSVSAEQTSVRKLFFFNSIIYLFLGQRRLSRA